MAVPPVRRGRLLHDAGISMLSSLVLPLTSLATGPLLARALGPEGRGQMTAVLAPIFIASFVASMAVPEATIYAIAKRGVSFARATRASAGLLLGYGVIATAALWALAPLLARQSPELTDDIRIAGLVLPLLMLTLMQRFALNGQRWYRLANLERVSAALTRLCTLVGLALIGVLTVGTAVWANIGSALFAGALLLVISRRRVRRTAAAAAGADPDPEPPRTVRSIALYGLRGWGGVFGNLVSWRVDQALLAVMVGPRLLGYYVVAVSLSELPGVATGVLRNLIFAESSQRNDVVLAARAARTLGALMAVAAVVGILTAELMVEFLFGAAFAPAVPLAQVLFVATVPLVMEQALGAGLLSVGRPGVRAVSQAVSAAVTVAGLLVLIPAMGAMGAAVTSLAAYLLTLALTTTFLSRASGLSAHELLFARPADVSWLVREGRRVLRRRRTPSSPDLMTSGKS